MNDKPLIEVKYDEPQMGAANFGGQIVEQFGQFQQVTAIPTWTPRTFRDSIALDTTSTKLYYYDFTNNQWRTLGASNSYGGYVDSGGSGTLPTGWSSSYNGTSKVYTVTHNLGTTSYGVVPAAMGSGALVGYFIPQQLARNTNDFQVVFTTTGGAAGATEFNFILTLIS